MKNEKQYFIDKFAVIPEEKWTVGTFNDNLGRRCALGHCGWSFPCTLTEEGFNLGNLLKDSVSHINDGRNLKYQQPTPKARILAALQDLP